MPDLPHNFEVEQAMLGSILVNNRAYHAVSEILEPMHFADPVHVKLYETVAKLIEKGQQVSAFTLKTYVEADLKQSGGMSYIAGLVSASADAVDAASYGKTIRDLYIRRKLIGLAAEASVAAYSGDVDNDGLTQIESLERGLYDLASTGQEGGFKTFGKALTEATTAAASAYKRDGRLVGVSTGLTELDRLLGGLHKSDLIIIAGRPSMGKTALATNIAFNAALAYRTERGEDGKPVTVDGASVGFFSLEMSSEQLATRILSEQAQIASERIRRGDLTSKDFDRVLNISSTIEALPLYIDDSAALTVSALRTRARRLKRTHGLDLIVVDYLQLITPGKRTDGRVNEVSEITRGLKTLAKELNVPVIALSQLSRGVEQREDKRPQLSDLRDSGSIEQDADVVAFVYRDEYYAERQRPNQNDGENDERFGKRVTQWEARMEAAKGRAEVLVQKQRHGPTGTIHLSFEGAYTRFSNLGQQEQREAA